MRNAYIVTGTVTDPQTVLLDEALPANLTRVRLVVEPVQPGTSESYMTVMDEIRQGQEARGHVPPTREEVDEYLQAERDSWD